MSLSYHIPIGPASAELEIKKSRFIGRAHPVENRQQAMAIIESLKQEFPDARHICWAYVLGNQVSAAMSDDGEPSGTAGKPILNVLQHKSIGNALVAVVRYFGGIKLGAGGLVRAYSGAAQSVVELLPLSLFVARCEVEVEVGFAQEQVLRHWCQQHDGHVVEVRYEKAVMVRLAVEEHTIPELAAWCASVGAILRA